MSFQYRSYQKELLDRTDIPFEDIKRNMEELDFINRYLGGHQITLTGLSGFINANKHSWHIAEIGCGGGNNLRAIKKWFKRKGIKARLTGIDINKECIEFAKAQQTNDGITFVCSDYSAATFEDQPDVIFSSLFCHHFKEEDLRFMMDWMFRNSIHGFFINDLHRHPLAYHSIKILTRLFSKSYLVKNDAPLSVKRGFSKKEWEEIFNDSCIKYDIEWKWAFRWLISCHK